MQEFRIPKRAVQVDVTPAGGVSRRVEVYLAEFASNHPGGEQLAEILKKSAFLPAKDIANQKMTFLNCAGLAVVRVAREVEPTADDSGLEPPTEHKVEVTLVGGQKLKGLLTYTMPPERSRLIDFLNASEQFIPLVDGDQVALINRDQIAQVELLTP